MRHLVGQLSADFDGDRPAKRVPGNNGRFYRFRFQDSGYVATEFFDRPDVPRRPRLAVLSEVNGDDSSIGTGGEQGAAACRGERQQQLEAILEREQARGRERPTLERTTDAILAPLYYRAVFTNEPLTSGWAYDLVSHLVSDENGAAEAPDSASDSLLAD